MPEQSRGPIEPNGLRTANPRAPSPQLMALNDPEPSFGWDRRFRKADFPRDPQILPAPRLAAEERGENLGAPRDEGGTEYPATLVRSCGSMHIDFQGGQQRQQAQSQLLVLVDAPGII